MITNTRALIREGRQRSPSDDGIDKVVVLSLNLVVLSLYVVVRISSLVFSFKYTHLNRENLTSENDRNNGDSGTGKQFVPKLSTRTPKPHCEKKPNPDTN